MISFWDLDLTNSKFPYNESQGRNANTLYPVHMGQFSRHHQNVAQSGLDIDLVNIESTSIYSTGVGGEGEVEIAVNELIK